jgi:hypothetical protein
MLTLDLVLTTHGHARMKFATLVQYSIIVAPRGVWDKTTETTSVVSSLCDKKQNTRLFCVS